MRTTTTETATVGVQVWHANLAEPTGTTTPVSAPFDANLCARPHSQASSFTCR